MAVFTTIGNKYFDENYAKGYVGEGSYCRIDDKENYIHVQDKGLVLKKGEHNYYDDSDFYVVVWDLENNKATEYNYASTRYYSYNDWAEVDASPEIQALYQDWLKKEERRKKNEKLQAYREKYLHYSHKSGLSIRQTLRLMRAVGKDFEELILVKLLGAYHNNRMRSAYRKSLAEQVVAWVNNPEPEYKSPLSPRQLITLLPPRQRPAIY